MDRRQPQSALNPFATGTASGRTTHGSRRLRSSTALTAFASVVLLGAATLPANAQFTRLFGFGDSYADTGDGPGGAFRLAGRPCIYAPNCTFTGSTTFVQSLQGIYGLPGMVNYAIGGARTDNTNTLVAVPVSPGGPATPIVPPLPGYAYEIQQLNASGTRFTDRDLITLSIGGNDLSGVDVRTLTAEPQQTAQIVGSAVASAVRAVDGVQQMVALGARNISWLSTGSSRWFPERTLGVGNINFTDAQRDAWAETYYQQTQQLLAPLSRAGIRIFLFNFGILQQRVAENPTLYGFVSATNCEAGPASPSTPPGVRAGFAGCFYQNSVHPTGAAMALVATYMANQVDAPTTVVPQGRITTAIATGFTGSVFGRLDASRNFAAYGLGNARAYASPTKAAPALKPEDRWSVYGDSSYGSGNQDRQLYNAGYDYHAVGGNFGVEYRPDAKWRVGATFGYSEPEINLGIQNAHDHIKSYQFAGYGSYTDCNWFADALAAYGRHDFALERQGVIDIIRGATSAETFTAAARTGYLFDAGAFRVGPIAGLNYARGVIGGYTETGDVLLTMIVDKQTLDALTGNAGVQLRLPFALKGGVYSPFINLTAEHDFLGSSRIVTTTLVTAPLLPILTPVAAQDRTYGKVAAGIGAAITGGLSATLTAATTFARSGGNDLSVSGGVRAAF
jgi:outer membrane autotransporter protein